MIKLSLTLLLLAHLTGPGMAYAPIQDEYRVEVLRDRINDLHRYKLKCILKGWNPVDKNIWR